MQIHFNDACEVLQSGSDYLKLMLQYESSGLYHGGQLVGVAPGKLTDPSAQFLLLDRRHRHGPALGGAVLAHLTAGTALGRPESFLQNCDSSVAP